jgi:hypothetical protein
LEKGEQLLEIANPTANKAIAIKLSPEIEQKLRERAAVNGLSLEVYLEELAERDANANGRPDALTLAVQRLTNRAPTEIIAEREQILKSARRGRPLPEGKTLLEVVEGSWPGDETDEEIRTALERLS